MAQVCRAGKVTKGTCAGKTNENMSHGSALKCSSWRHEPQQENSPFHDAFLRWG